MTEHTHTPRTHGTGHPVVAGVDGSPHSLAAVDLAAGEAARRRLPLELVHGFAPPLPLPSFPPGLAPLAASPEISDGLAREQVALREQAERLLHEVAGRVRGAYPDLPVVTRLRDGYPAAVLTEASRQAALIAVGHRGLGGFAGLLAGSVGVQLAQHAACPVIIVRGDPGAGPAADAPVVVGVDGSDEARHAAEFAADTALLYEAPLVVLHTWLGDTGWQPEQVQAGEPPPTVPDVVTRTVTALTDKFPQLRIHPDIRQVPAREALVDASQRARLVVVGSRGRGGFQGLLLGSVSQALIHHAHCPVAVYPSVRPHD